MDSLLDLERGGLSVWQRIDQVIVLTECLRQKEDLIYQGLLQRARDVTLTQDDVDLLNTCMVSCRKSKHEILPELSITMKNKLRHELNRLHVIEFAKTRQQKVYIFPALHKLVALKSSSTQSRVRLQQPPEISFAKMLEIDDGNLLKGSNFLLYTKNMPIMCLSNISTCSGVVNGMCGTATSIVPDPSGT